MNYLANPDTHAVAGVLFEHAAALDIPLLLRIRKAAMSRPSAAVSCLGAFIVSSLLPLERYRRWQFSRFSHGYIEPPTRTEQLQELFCSDDRMVR